MNRKDWILLGGIILVTVCMGLLIGIWFFRLFEPYRIEPLHSKTAPASATPGFTVDPATKTLSVMSSNPVVVVARPDFQYTEVWIIADPDQGAPLKQYTCTLPDNYSTNHINSVQNQVPLNILKVAKNNNW